MAYIFFEQEAATGSLKSVSDLSVPAGATHVEIQADSQDVRYTMDGTDPTQSSGMLFEAGAEEELYLIRDLRNLKFISGDPLDGNLNFHYLAGTTV